MIVKPQLAPEHMETLRIWDDGNYHTATLAERALVDELCRWGFLEHDYASDYRITVTGEAALSEYRKHVYA